MSIQARRIILGVVAVGLLVLLAAGGVGAYCLGWLNGASAPNETERAFLDGWRAPDCRAEPAMSETPFTVQVEGPAPQVEEIVIENGSSRLVRNFWFRRADMPNFYSAETIANSATAGLRTETEKVIALWELFRRYYYNYNPISAGGMLMDPPTLLAVTGTAQCNYAATALATLCELTGVRTRLVGVQYDDDSPQIAHCIMEAFADGRWICLDPDGHAAYKRADGEWASVADLTADATPVENAAHAYYPPKVLAEAYRKGHIEYYEPDESAPTRAERQRDPAHFSIFHHYMRFDLLPGERVEIFPSRTGRCYELPLPVTAMGVMKWSYTPRHFMRDELQGLLAENVAWSVERGTLTLRRVEPLRDAALVLPMTSPFLMTGARVIFKANSSEPARLSLLPFVRGRIPAFERWLAAGEVKGDSEITLDAFFSGSPIFGYALKLSVPAGGVRIESLDVATTFQCAPQALPGLTAGANEFLLCSGDPPATPSAYSRRGAIGAQFDNRLRIGFIPSRSGSTASLR